MGQLGHGGLPWGPDLEKGAADRRAGSPWQPPVRAWKRHAVQPHNLLYRWGN